MLAGTSFPAPFNSPISLDSYGALDPFGAITNRHIECRAQQATKWNADRAVGTAGSTQMGCSVRAHRLTDSLRTAEGPITGEPPLPQG
mmetsp:Transcript_97408/g.167933  ORF Transcript_97408/g.167933 Transcript_97408/m.167933 type:complete len:88 (+) Transcript_97408:215-478(+)